MEPNRFTQFCDEFETAMCDEVLNLKGAARKRAEASRDHLQLLLADMRHMPTGNAGIEAGVVDVVHAHLHALAAVMGFIIAVSKDQKGKDPDIGHMMIAFQSSTMDSVDAITNLKRAFIAFGTIDASKLQFGEKNG